ncbi:MULTISPECIES: hypothetical protein [Pseudoalteromonas]|uniref:Uncharacterized protein n=1 Tax=Pseudoalteromonas obscura TaxID=3048491 RepID=A0ABT7ENE3_9GAMM|nr:MULTISPECIES: hypothetical protein [Pseudoalteromonas]MBQ4835175.1 hypothetical protein [Pseudoalteromonas luteoviolacea]MDK2596571.1 hypothetical protein [Pseudoalteromonas sp. P94(2023)]
MIKKSLIGLSILASTTVIADDSLDICLITGEPSSDVSFEKIHKIKYGKGTYGSVSDILPHLARKANAVNANAVVNYVGSQRFGFFPWRFVRPVVRGEAAKLYLRDGQTCASIGGATVREVIQTNLEPHLIQR